MPPIATAISPKLVASGICISYMLKLLKGQGGCQDEEKQTQTRKGMVKNRQDRLVVLNKIAKEVIERQRGKDRKYVFAYNGKPLTRILNTSWKKARERAGLAHVRVHDLKHTFGFRLRMAGVSMDDRKDLLGHKQHGEITAHYSVAELSNLIKAANTVCDNLESTRIVFRKNTLCKELFG